MIRCLIFSLSLFLGMNVFAQETPGTASPSPVSTPSPDAPPVQLQTPTKSDVTPVETREDYVASGFFLGLSYENLRASAVIKYKNANSTYSFNGDDDIGMLGLRLGFADVPKDGLGFNLALTAEQSSQKYINNKNYMIYKGEGNLTIGTSVSNQMALYGFGGFHLANLDPSDDVSSLGFGLQLGAGFAFNSHLSLELGYTLTLHSFKDSFFDANPNLDKDGTSYSLSGLLAHLNYSF